MYKILFIAILLIVTSVSSPKAEKLLPVIKNGWYEWTPYQFIKDVPGYGKKLVGMDVELVHLITEKTGRRVTYDHVYWKAHQNDLQSGKRHFAAGATYTEERAKTMHFSQPYRFEENSLFVLREDEKSLQFDDISTFLKELKKKKYKIAVIDGFIYADPKINEYIADEKNKDLIVKTADDRESLSLLSDGLVKGFLADRIVGASIIRAQNKGHKILEVSLNIKTPIHLMFSKKSVPESVVDEFNKQIQNIIKSREYKNKVTGYLLPILLIKTIDSPWFLILEILGTFAFAMSGVLIAFEKRSSLLAGFLFAFFPSFGGGMVRDVLFDVPVHILRTPIFFLIVASVVFVSYFLSIIFGHRLGDFFSKLVPRRLSGRESNFYLVIFEGFGLATFTIVGIFVTLMVRLEPFWLLGPFFGLLTSISGGIIRDLIANRKIHALSGWLYGEWSLIWGFLFSYYIYENADTISSEVVSQCIIVTLLGVFLSYVWGYVFKLRNLRFLGC